MFISTSFLLRVKALVGIVFYVIVVEKQSVAQ
jgi:hypothetical protein